MANARHLTPDGMAAEAAPWKAASSDTEAPPPFSASPPPPDDITSEEPEPGAAAGGGCVPPEPEPGPPAAFPSSSSSSSTATTGVHPRSASTGLPAKVSASRPNRLPRPRLDSFDEHSLTSPGHDAVRLPAGMSASTSEALRRLHDLTREMQRSLEQCKSRLSKRRGSLPVASSPLLAVAPVPPIEAFDGYHSLVRPGREARAAEVGLYETRHSPEGREATNSWRSSGSDDRDAANAKILPPPGPFLPRCGTAPVGGMVGPGLGHISVPNLIAAEPLALPPTSAGAWQPPPKVNPRFGLSAVGAKRQQQLRQRRQRNLTTGIVTGAAGYRTIGATTDTLGTAAGGGGIVASVSNNCVGSPPPAMRSSVSFCGIDGTDEQSTGSQSYMGTMRSETNGYPDPAKALKSDSLVDVLHRRYYSHQYIANARSRPFLQMSSFDNTNDFLQPQTLHHSFGRQESVTDRKGIQFPKSKSMNDASCRQGFSAEVVEACRWLIEAGFPQYGQMFEDGDFPLDLETIREDHRFMDDDALSALFRRINTLNDFVLSQRKDSADVGGGGGEMLINKMGRAAAAFDATDGDAGEEYALSKRWQFERDTRRWSRVDADSRLSPPPADADANSNADGKADADSATPALSRGRSKASKRSAAGARTRTDESPSAGRSLLRSASLRLRTAVSRFRRGDLNFRSLRRAKKSTAPVSADDSATATRPARGREGRPRTATDPGRATTLPVSASAAPLAISSPIPVPVESLPRPMSATAHRPSPQRVLMSPASRVGPPPTEQRRQTISGAEGSGEGRGAASDSSGGPGGGAGGMQILVNDTIDTGSGDKINIRTGSFMGKAGHRYEAFLRRRNEAPSAATAPGGVPTAAKHESSPANVGQANGCEEEDAPTSELDRILQALYTDIDMLDEMMDSSGRIPRNSTMSAPTSPRLLDVPASGDPFTSAADVMAQFTEIAAYDLDAQIVELKRLERLRRGDGKRTSLDRGTSSSRGHSSERENSLDSSTAYRSTTSTLRRNAPSRWSSVERTCRQSVYQHDQSIGGMSVKQLILLRKIALLKLTTIMEKHCPPHKSLFSWAFPKLLRRGRSHSETDNPGKVFGVSLSTCLQRTGMFLPQAILNAFCYLRNEGKTAHGIFRRAGGKARTLGLRERMDKDPMWNDFSAWQAYDVADVVKLYFRELPECLLTNKLSATLINIFIYLPLELRLEALQWGVLRLPDENRMVLQCLLHFLRDMAEHSDVTLMPASNLAMCLAPTLFNFPHALPSGLSPKRLRRVTGSPDPKDLADQKAAHECLTVMIQFSHQLFLIPENILNQCQFDSDELGEPPSLNILAPPRSDSLGRDWQSWAGERLASLLRDCREKGRGWVHVQSNQSGPVEVHHKKVNDGHPLKLWRCAVDVEAPPEVLLDRLWHERSRWDPGVEAEDVLEHLSDDAEVLHRSLATLAPPHPGRQCVLLRARQRGLEGGACALLSSSTSFEGSPNANHLSSLPAFVMQEDVLVDPCGTGKSRVHWLSRVDIRGFTAEWYGSTWGNFIAHLLQLLQQSFVKTIDSRETSL